MPSIQQIIKSSVDSDSDLLKLADALDVEVNQIDFKHKLKLDVDYAILNMGTPFIGGTHWMAVSNKDKLYFDPLQLPPPLAIPRDYETAPFRIQNEQWGHCGDYCVLWLYFLQHDSLHRFYNLFTHLPSLI
ncbi:unnamed protein product [Phytophthora lilii]|uniref:Unnamed protein product n=1 Tax=Phytophthora lilii TaxID=2077276 RepID=A0A9W7D9H4_9STRA|nr:unnamed protein product [Phytophthora lilii]